MTRRQQIFNTLIVLAIGIMLGYLIGISVPQASAPVSQTPMDYPVSGVHCPVMHVADGDTIQVWIGRSVETVRLLHIDTPEMEEPGYQKARDALKDLTGRGPVRLEGEHPGRLERGHYGRYLAYVYIGSQCANVEMVRQGWSKYWTKFGQSRLENEFNAAEAEAKSASRGLWRDN